MPIDNIVVNEAISGLQISMRKWNIFDKISLFLHQTLLSYHSLESSWKDYSYKWSLDRVWLRNKKNSKSNTHVIWSTEFKYSIMNESKNGLAYGVEG